MTKSSFIVVYANMYFSIIRLEICVLYFRIKNRQTFTIHKNQVKKLLIIFGTGFDVSLINRSLNPLPASLYLLFSLSPTRLSHQPISLSPPGLSLSTFLAILSPPLSIYFSRYPLPVSLYLLFSYLLPISPYLPISLSPPRLSLCLRHKFTFENVFFFAWTVP